MSKKETVTAPAFPRAKIAGKSHILTPSLGAARRVAQRLMGLKAALERVMAMDVDAIALVIAAGAGLDFSEEETAAKFVDEVFATKPLYLVSNPASEFLLLMINGGAPKGDEDGKVGVAGDGAPDAGND